MLILRLEINIRHYLLAISKGNNNLKKIFDIFTHTLFSKDSAQKEQDSGTLHEQACLAIALNEQKLELTLPEKIKEKLFRLYEE